MKRAPWFWFFLNIVATGTSFLCLVLVHRWYWYLLFPINTASLFGHVTSLRRTGTP